MATTSPVSTSAEPRYAVPLAIAAAALLLCWPAFYNGFPLVYGDSASYIETLDPRKAHWARPVFYTLFLFPFHWRVWLWPTIFAQSLLVAHIVYVSMRTTCVTVRAEAYLGVMAALALFSSLPWFTSMIMPDVFTGVVVLGMYLLCFVPERLGRIERWYVFALTAGAIACHLSHLALAAGLVIVILVTKAVLGMRSRSRALAIVMAVGPPLLAAAAHLAANAWAYHGISLSPASPIFLLARMIGDGTAQAYLREHCPERGYVLCAYLDELPQDADEFLWDDYSVFKRAGGPALREEAREIVGGTLRAYPAWQLRSIVANASRQLFVFMGDEVLTIEQPAERPIGQYIRYFYPADYDRYIGSRQSTGRMPSNAISAWHAFSALVGLAASVFLFIEFVRRGDREMIALFIVIIAALAGNALVTGGLASVHGRYQSRIVWLLVLYAALGAQYLYLCGVRESERREA
jgi:hypothetical protein